MGNGIGTIHVRPQRGKLVVQGDGKTPRGQRFIKETEALAVKSMADPNFKAQLSAAVNKMLPEEGTQP